MPSSAPACFDVLLYLSHFKFDFDDVESKIGLLGITLLLWPNISHSKSDMLAEKVKLVYLLPSSVPVGSTGLVTNYLATGCPKKNVPKIV